VANETNPGCPAVELTVYINGGEHTATTIWDGSNWKYPDGSPRPITKFTFRVIGAGDHPGQPRYFTGIMDELAIYNRALSADEIKQHYKAGKP